MLERERCPMCDPWIEDVLANPYHAACLLREVLGGIGHLLDHDHFCVRGGDPNAGLSRYQSALCVSALVARLGEGVLSAAMPKPPLDLVCEWAGLSETAGVSNDEGATSER